MIIRYLKLIIALAITISFVACENEAQKGISKVHWDRDMCSRCVMVVSDRKNTVQVRNPETQKTYMFDDIGCMVLWFDEEKIEWQDRAIIWITDVNSGEFIDAREAFYDTNNITPMAYGFSAHKTKEAIEQDEEIISFDELIKRVKKIGK